MAKLRKHLIIFRIARKCKNAKRMITFLLLFLFHWFFFGKVFLFFIAVEVNCARKCVTKRNAREISNVDMSIVVVCCSQIYIRSTKRNWRLNFWGRLCPLSPQHYLDSERKDIFEFGSFSVWQRKRKKQISNAYISLHANFNHMAILSSFVIACRLQMEIILERANMRKHKWFIISNCKPIR